VSIRLKDLGPSSSADTEDTTLQRLARQLFAIPGVTGLLFGYDFVTLEKTSSANWDSLQVWTIIIYMCIRMQLFFKCLYMRIHVCMLHVYTYNVYLCTYVYTYICIHVQLHIFIYIHIHGFITFMYI